MSGPYEKEGTASGFAVGAGALTHPPSVSNVPVQNRRGGTLGRPISMDWPKGLPCLNSEGVLKTRRGGDDSPYQGEMSSAARQRG